MTECPICQHAKVEALQAALNSGRLAAVVATQFRVKKLDLVKHLQHAPIQAAPSALQAGSLLPGGIATYIDSTREDLAQPPFTRFKQAWQDVKDDTREQARMVAWLNEQLQRDEMGL